ncbi:lysozyme inhibitor LprI family protein [Lederbergia graminis]|uniref:Lysozyme inhibitor LprI family protein n=1 Tax=Lederbergia graminis TaxID=735518 RepID=A0ABW0LNK6_9BACI
MKKKFAFLPIIIIVVLLAACGDKTKESNAEPDNTSDSVTQESEVKNDGVAEVEETSEESNAENDVSDELAEQQETEQSDADASEQSETEVVESKREEYLKKLNEMQEVDRNSEVGTTVAELEEQEAKRYEKWDAELNEIYRLLEEQLSSDEMEQLREEQRSWIKERDEIAKESSEKYKGGSTEALEYVATQAELTRERCFTLVAQYMK